MNKKKTLTKAEEQVMQAVWKTGRGFIRDIMEQIPPPKPHQNTVATILKILVEKEFLAIDIIGRQHQYHPLITKQAYSKSTIKSLVKSYFGGSFTEAVSFMVKENTLSLDDLEILLRELKKEKK